MTLKVVVDWSEKSGGLGAGYPEAGGNTSIRNAGKQLADSSGRHIRDCGNFHYTGYTQKNGAVSKVNKKCISHLTRAQRTPSAAATVQVSHALITILQCMHPGSHDTHPHGNQIHPRLGVACPL
jgi:hypothetical protein